MIWAAVILAVCVVGAFNVWKFLQGDISLGVATACTALLLFTLVIAIAKAST